MDVRRSLICFFFLTLRDGNSGLINAENLNRTGTEGGDITVGCSFSFSGYRRLFCKGRCEEGNILVETTDDTAQRGRYSIRYEEGFYPARSTLLYVSITKLTKSDEGWYQCGLDRSLPASDSYEDFRITVKEAPTSSKPEVTPRPFSKSAPSTSTLTTTQSLNSTPSSASPERTTPPHQGTTAPAAGHGVVVYVGGILLVMFIILSVTLLIFCRKRARKEPPLGIDNGTDTEANQQYEEIREEGRRSRSPPVELSTVYSYANYKPNGEESTDEYSLVTAAKTEDDEGNLEYSEVDFSNNAASLHSALSGHTDNVLYAVHRAADASPPLYSTVSM